MSDQEIKQKTKATFHEYIKSCVDKFAFKWLLEEKKKQSKCSTIFYERLKIQEYVVTNEITTF